MRTKTLIIALLGAILHRASIAQYYRPYHGWEHVHSAYSDGEFTITELKDRAKRYGLQFIFMSDHGDCFYTPQSMGHRAGKEFLNFHQHSGVNSFSDYLEEIGILNEDNSFVIHPGVEITGAKIPSASYCHFNAFYRRTTYQSYTYDGKYDPGDLGALKSLLKKEDTTLIYNHPKDCPAWMNSAHEFDGIELMNDFSFDLNPLKNKAKENYELQRNLYLRSVKAGYRQFVVGGQDFHSDGSWKASGMGLVTTAIFADQLTQNSLFQAMEEGKTVALRNTTILALNQVPSKATVSITGNFELAGKLRLQKAAFTSRAGKIWLQLYKNGVVIAKTQAVKGATTGTTVEVSFTIKDPSPAGEGVTSYIAEIPQLMVTSPFWVQKAPSKNFLVENPEIMREAVFSFEAYNQVENHIPDDEMDQKLLIAKDHTGATYPFICLQHQKEVDKQWTMQYYLSKTECAMPSVTKSLRIEFRILPSGARVITVHQSRGTMGYMAEVLPHSVEQLISPQKPSITQEKMIVEQKPPGYGPRVFPITTVNQGDDRKITWDTTPAGALKKAEKIGICKNDSLVKHIMSDEEGQAMGCSTIDLFLTKNDDGVGIPYDQRQDQMPLLTGVTESRLTNSIAWIIGPKDYPCIAGGFFNDGQRCTLITQDKTVRVGDLFGKCSTKTWKGDKIYFDENGAISHCKQEAIFKCTKFVQGNCQLERIVRANDKPWYVVRSPSSIFIRYKP